MSNDTTKRRLDLLKPYATVHGSPTAKFNQNGVEFGPDMYEVEMSDDITEAEYLKDVQEKLKKPPKK